MEQKKETLLELNHVSVRYQDTSEPVLQEIDLAVRQSEITCVIGESGCGKSTLLQSILCLPGHVKVTKGDVLFQGGNLHGLSSRKLRTVRGTGIGVVFQEPGASLDPIRKICRQFYDAMHAHNPSVTRSEVRGRAAELLKSMEFTDPERILDSCPVQLSGGMNQRVAIALAMALDPAVLLADEPTSALDVTVQAQVVKELMGLRDQYGTAILMITHNMGVVAKMADKVAVMYGGRIIEYGTRTDILKQPVHPYTRALLKAVPKLDGQQPMGILGQKPDHFPEAGCAFAPRCAQACDSCKTIHLQKHLIQDEHWVMCRQEVLDAVNP